VIPTFAAIVAKTLRDQLAPIDLSASHAFGPIRSLTPDALVALGVVAGLGAVVVFLRRRVPLAAFAAWWFPVCLLPLAVLPLITSLALYQENRGYLSAVAVAMLGGPLMAWWWGAGATRAMLFRRGLLVVVFVTMAVAVVQRNPVWLDDLTLWTDVLKKAPGNQAAYVNVGAAYQARGDFDEAAEVYRRALERFPNNGILHNNLGVIYRSHGDLDRAAEAFQAAIRVSPGFAMPYFNLGLLLQGAGYRAEAIASYQRFLELAPGQQGTPASILKARQHLNELRGTAGEPAGASPLSN
jgi:tetratricopeptide (TPR) repeat protein